MFTTIQNKKINDMDSDHENEPIKRFDFNHAPPKQLKKTDEILGSVKKNLVQAINDDFNMPQNSTNSNSPISVTSLDEIFENNDQKMGNLHQKSSFYSAHHNFINDDKSSGASSLFSSGM